MSRRIRLILAGAVITTCLVVAGCTADRSQLDVQLSQQWQTQVVTIAETAKTGDYAGALQALADLETEATQARQDGEISAERAAIIQQSIAAVRADLEAASSPAPEAPPEDDAVTDQPAPDPVEDRSTDDSNDNANEDNNDNGNDNNNDNADANGNKRDQRNEGNTDANPNGNPSGNPDGNPSGNANGNPNGNANGTPDANANGNGNGKKKDKRAKGNADANPNGNPSGNANGKGNGIKKD